MPNTSGENPYHSPGTSELIAEHKTGSLLRRSAVPLGLVLPYLIQIGFYFIYQPVNEGWTVKKFGCGCPDLTGKNHFNANHFNLILIGIVDLLSVPSWLISARRVAPRAIRPMVASFGAGVIVGISLVVWWRMVWL